MRKNTEKTDIKKKEVKVPFFFKITLIITLVVALIGGGLVYVASEQFSAQVEEEVQQKLITESREKAHNFKNNLNFSLSRVDSIGNDINKKEFFQKIKAGTLTQQDLDNMTKEMEAEMALMGGKWEQSMMVYAGDHIVKSDGIGGLGVGHDVLAEGPVWYMGAIKDLKKTVSPIMLSPIFEDTPVMPTGYPILDDDGSLLGVYMASMHLRQFADELVIEQNGMKSFVVDGNGNVILATDPHDIYRYNMKDSTFEGKAYNSDTTKLYKDITTNKSGISSFTREGVKNIASYNIVEANDGVTLYMITYIPEKLYLRPLNKINNSLTIYLILGLGLTLLVSLVVAKYVSKPIKETYKQLNLIANGDYTGKQHEKIMKRNDEFGVLGKSIEKMQNNLVDTNKELLRKAQTLKETSNVFAAAIQQSATGMSEISMQTNDMSLRNQSNAAGVEEMACSIEEMIQNVTTISERVEEINVNTSGVLTETKNGMTSMDLTVTAINKVNEDTHEVQQVFTELKKYSAKINDIVDIINEITRNTNLLAINASIEASRAGVAGKGFSVVADEVRNLAQQSSKSVVEIKKIVGSIQDEINRAGEIIDEERKSVDSGVNATKDTKQKFEGILRALSETARQVEEIAQMAVSQSSISSQMEKAINDIATSTSENANSAEEINISVRQQNNAMHDLSEKTESLNSVAIELEDGAKKFKLE